MKLTAESIVINDGKLNTNIDNAQTSADNAQTSANNAQSTANTANTKADNAQSTADDAVSRANNAQGTANQAKTVADNTAQYFWVKTSGTDTGVHITEKTQSQFVANPSGGNLLARSNGIAVRDGLTELASFGATKAQVGKDSTGHTIIEASGMQIYGSDGTVELANIGYGSGKSEGGSTATAPYYSLGQRLSGSTVGNYSVANGYDCTASGFASHAEGRYTIASEVGAHAEGHGTVASDYEAHAEGNGTTASQFASHAEGNGTTASGIASHAEGMQTQATGAQSHAGGYHTIADGDFQTAIGKYNVADSLSLFIVGKGTGDSARANAFRVDSNGDVRVKGNLYTNCANDSSGGTQIFETGVINKGDVSIGGDWTSIGNWIKSNYVASKWVTARVNATSSGYFGTASFSIMAMCSSTNCGYGWLQSDHTNTMVFFRLSSGSFYFYHPTLTQVN